MILSRFAYGDLFADWKVFSFPVLVVLMSSNYIQSLAKFATSHKNVKSIYLDLDMHP